MCGILFTNKDICDVDYVIQYLKNRGPDNTSLINLYDYNFLHVLLSMTGQDFTIQPFVYDNVVILFNGEIYNYKDFGDFNSDGECIIEAYRMYGDDFVKHFDGEFAITLFDKTREMIIFTTDVFAIKPLWYSLEGEFIGVSSYKSCLSRLEFTNIIEADPNTTYFINMIDNSIIKKSSVYDFDLTQHKTSYDDWNIAFENSILKRAQNIKHNIYVGLSSGYDSGAIACVLNKYNIDFKAYTIYGSENMDILNQRLNIHKNNKIIDIDVEEFKRVKTYLKNNCEEYNMFIDNDEEKNMNLWIDNLTNLTNSNSIVNAQNKVLAYKNALDRAKNKPITDDNGSVGLGTICGFARPNDELIYLTGSGADEIISDYGWKGVRHYRHSTIGGHFPDDLASVFPWRNFFGNTQRAYLRKEEYIAGTFGIEGRYPFLDKHLVQEFLWLVPELKNRYYKAPIHNYMVVNNYPFAVNEKIGFNCGIDSQNINGIVQKKADRIEIGVTSDPSLIVSIL
jgi:asparagine synthetase B (glutamine-hydrolysing)